ncbi:hexokinase [Lophiostoma macrostomum CBS 122681]|uniref:Phosphotransferase n=1 Tax=Lophiostoma macrostomum CBS 122681 TaxID=1314788 RepID=A0A6A6TNS4_9PLEO|nr:hexokinase [Lophiostoma macrostomum CBS 122681]
MPPISSLDLVASDSWRQRSELSSMADLPPDLDSAMSALDQQFWVSTAKLKDIVARFREELKEGLEKEGGNIPMNLSWVLGLSSGREKGRFLAIDLGGTNLRVCLKDGSGHGPNGKHTLTQTKYTLPATLKTSSADHLWTFITDALATFLSDHNLSDKYTTAPSHRLPLGFTFSYPATQHRIDHGILQRWTKGFDIAGVEGEDVTAQFRSHLAAKNLPVDLVCLVNDTVGAMIASAYNDPQTIAGAIFGTGCNAAYMQSLVREPASVPKLELREDEWEALDREGKQTGQETVKMAINCEYGAFDNALRVLPRTEFDDAVDRESPRPGEQAFEKMSAGLYLGEIFRLVLVGLVRRELLFTQNSKSMSKDGGELGKEAEERGLEKLKKPYTIDTGFLSAIEDDESPQFRQTRDLFNKILHLSPSDPEIEFCRRLAELIAVRGARLCACGIAAICLNEGIQQGHVAADGSVANKHPKFKRRWAEALGEILDWGDGNDGPIRLTSAEDGSGVGVAVIAAMTLERAQRGVRIGMGES